MAAQKVIMWNSAGIRTSANTTSDKMDFFNNTFKNGNFAIAAFIETHHKNEEDIPYKIKEHLISHHLVHSTTPKDHTHKGIICLINKEYEILQHNEPIQGTLMNVEITHKTSKKEHNVIQLNLYNSNTQGTTQNCSSYRKFELWEFV